MLSSIFDKGKQLLRLPVCPSKMVSVLKLDRAPDKRGDRGGERGAGLRIIQR